MKTYNGKEVTVVWGPIIFSGFGEDEFCAIAYNSDDYDLHMGSDGKGTRSANNDNSAQVTVTMAQSSDANDQVSALGKADRLSVNGVMHPLMVKDNSGRSIYMAKEAYLKKRPDATFGKTTSEREYIFETDNLEDFTGGN